MYRMTTSACLSGIVFKIVSLILYLYSQQRVKTTSFLTCSSIIHWLKIFSVYISQTSPQFYKRAYLSRFCILNSRISLLCLVRFEIRTPKMAKSLDLSSGPDNASYSISKTFCKNFRSKGIKKFGYCLENSARIERTKSILYLRSKVGCFQNMLKSNTNWFIIFLSNQGSSVRWLAYPFWNSLRSNCSDVQNYMVCVYFIQVKIGLISSSILTGSSLAVSSMQADSMLILWCLQDIQAGIYILVLLIGGCMI